MVRPFESRQLGSRAYSTHQLAKGYGHPEINREQRIPTPPPGEKAIWLQDPHHAIHSRYYLSDGLQRGSECLPQPTCSSAMDAQDPKTQREQLRWEKRNGCANSARILSSVTQQEQSQKPDPSIWCVMSPDRRQYFQIGFGEPMATVHRPTAPPGVQPRNGAGFRSPLPLARTEVKGNADSPQLQPKLGFRLHTVTSTRGNSNLPNYQRATWPRATFLRSQGKRLCLPIPRKPGEAKQHTALWAWGSHGGRKASLEATGAPGVQQLAFHLPQGSPEPRAAGGQRDEGFWARRPTTASSGRS